MVDYVGLYISLYSINSINYLFYSKKPYIFNKANFIFFQFLGSIYRKKLYEKYLNNNHYKIDYKCFSCCNLFFSEVNICVWFKIIILKKIC